MVDYVKEEGTGKIFARLPGNQYVEITSPSQIDILEENGVEAFLNSAGNTVAQTTYGAGALLGVEGAEENYREAVTEQGLRSTISPAASGGAFVPDVAVGLATGGSGPIARRIGTTAAIEGGLGAAQNPDAPLQGALIQGTIGAAGAGALGGGAIARAGAQRGVDMGTTILNALPARAREAVQPAVDSVLNIPRAVGIRDSDAIRGGRSVNAASTPGAIGYDFAGSVDRGMPLTEGDYLAAAARRGDKDALAQADEVRGREELARSGNSVQGTTVNRIRAEQEEWLTERLAQELSDPSLDRLTIPNINAARQRIGNDLNDLLRNNEADLDIKLSAEDLRNVQDALDDVPDAAATASFNKVKGLVEDLLTKPEITGKEFNAVRNTLNQTRDRLIRKGGTYDAGLALDEVEGIMMSRLRDTMTPDQRELLDARLANWRIVKVLEGAARSTDAGGVARAGTIRNTYMRQNPLARKGYDNSAIWNDIQTADYVLNKANIPDSGTAPRMLRNMAATGLTAAGAGGIAGYLGN